MSPILIDIMNIIELRSSRFMTHVGEIMISVEGVTRELKKLRQLVQRKRHIKIELCVRLRVLRFFHVGHVVQNRQSLLPLAEHKWFCCKGREGPALSAGRTPNMNFIFRVVIWSTSKNCTKKRAACEARLFFLIQPIKSSICGVVVAAAVSVVVSPTPWWSSQYLS